MENKKMTTPIVSVGADREQSPNVCNESSDDSLLGAFKEVGQELKETFVSSKKIQATLILMNICVVIRKKSKNIFCPH